MYVCMCVCMYIYIYIHIKHISMCSTCERLGVPADRSRGPGPSGYGVGLCEGPSPLHAPLEGTLQWISLYEVFPFLRDFPLQGIFLCKTFMTLMVFPRLKLEPDARFASQAREPSQGGPRKRLRALSGGSSGGCEADHAVQCKGKDSCT